MVQHATQTFMIRKSVSQNEEINEFQLVHALITQSLKGLSENGKSSTLDENENQLAMETTSNNSLLSTICKTFSSLNTANGHRLISRSVRDIISQLRSSTDHCANSCANKSTEKPRRREKVAFRNRSNSSNTSDVQSTPSTNECKTEVEQISSNVHKKVLHFERCASSGQVEESLCSKCKKTKPPSLEGATSPTPSTSCAEACPGGTYYRPLVTNNNQTPPDQRVPDPITPMEDDAQEHIEPPKLTGRNLKRVPSERFQKMRRKVQRLMLPRSDDGCEEERTPRSPTDEKTFLQSIRIPNPAQIRNDPESRKGLMVRLPDHVLCNIFSHLDTRTLSALKCSCTDFNFIIVNFDIRSSDSRWTKDDRYIDDPCKQCRHQFKRGDMSLCRFHPKRYYADLPYGRSYWMCCLQLERSSPGCQVGLHDNHWLASYD
uniref:F-box only protein 46-like n=1 Tax=Phallusia mammillata TaxID=59560 RepID=A0A6F9DCV2_9ASCI|nr:F-box only protein 46-like [Phallusia mammillata]